MNTQLPPLRFHPVYKSYLWGGQRLASRFGRRGTPAVCAESWEISGHPDGMSVVAGGPFDGETLAALAERFGAALTGIRAADPARFPLLFKLIDARENLSVQVHPADDNADRVGGEAKTEMWYVLDRMPGASLYAGLKPGVTAEAFRAAMSGGEPADHLYRLEAKPGEALFIPGGLVHAIGAGCLFYEVQQASNTTFRLHDWGRVDARGQPRPLHIREAFEVIKPDLPAPRMLRCAPPPDDGANHWTEILDCPHFRFCRLILRQAEQVRLDGASFMALFVVAGAVSMMSAGRICHLPAGVSGLLPASAGDVRLDPADGPATVLVTTLGFSFRESD